MPQLKVFKETYFQVQILNVNLKKSNLLQMVIVVRKYNKRPSGPHAHPRYEIRGPAMSLATWKGNHWDLA